MTDPDATPTTPTLRRTALVSFLLVATLGLGVAARLAARPDPLPGPGPMHAGSGPVSLAAHLDRGSVLHGSDGLVRLELVLRGGQGDALPGRSLPTDLVVVLDRSGSMSGAPIATARAAVRDLVGRLAERDRFALVSYASDARVDVTLESASPAARERWLARLDGIGANGGTHLSGGLDRAHALLTDSLRSGRAPRVIVLSDGHANQGDYSLEGLRARASRAVGSEYVLSAVGIGDGFDENVMSTLADAGTGNFHYLPDPTGLAGVFADEFASARETVARALVVRVDPTPGTRVVSASGYPLEHAPDGGVLVRPGDLFAGQERRLWVTMHAPTDRTGEVALGALRVDFATPGGEARRVSLETLPALACVENEDTYWASFDGESYKRANLSDSLGALKQSVARKLKEGRVSEAVSEVEAYRTRSSGEQLRALGAFDPDEAEELDALADAVSAPAAAEPETRNRLGKSLLEGGRDDQRAGAKR